MINPRHLAFVQEVVNNSPYFQLLKMRVVKMEPGRAESELDYDKSGQHAFGGIHGGVYASLIDSATYWAAYCDLPEDKGATSIDLQVNFISMTRPGRLHAVGRVIHQGKSTCLCKASVYDAKGRLLAEGTSKLLILEGKQSLKQLMENTGIAGLPPKYTDQ